MKRINAEPLVYESGQILARDSRNLTFLMTSWFIHRFSMCKTLTSQYETLRMQFLEHNHYGIVEEYTAKKECAKKMLFPLTSLLWKVSSISVFFRSISLVGSSPLCLLLLLEFLAKIFEIALHIHVYFPQKYYNFLQWQSHHCPTYAISCDSQVENVRNRILLEH